MSGAERKRLFFALNPGATVREAAAAVQRDCGAEGRPVPPANFHVTLAFLGMQEAEVLPRILAVAGGLDFPPCEIVLDRLGRFRRAGVLWLGASEVPQPLAEFQRALVGALLDAGIGHDPKPWQPHLTLYRKLRTPPPTMRNVAIRWRLEGFSLVESVSVNRGVVYHDIAAWNASR